MIYIFISLQPNSYAFCLYCLWYENKLSEQAWNVFVKIIYELFLVVVNIMTAYFQFLGYRINPV